MNNKLKIDYLLTRTKRKTIAIYIRNGGVEVRAPLKTPKRELDKFVASKEKWIRDRLAESMKISEQKEAFELNYGDLLLYRGNKYPIAEKIGNRLGFDNTRFYMPPGLLPMQIKAVCIKIYRLLAKRDLINKTLDYAKQMSVMPSNVKINRAKTRWGSCSAKKSINYSWRLIMADDDVIEYVVVHELAHLTEMNHSKKFWRIVEGILPDYRTRQKRLKDLQKKLSAENWG